MSTSTYMNLLLPDPSVTLGPLWAQQIVDAFDVVDAHDHSSNSGVKVKPNGMLINDDLDFLSHAALNVLSLKLVTNGTTLTGPTNTLKVYSFGGDLYYTNDSGATIQITSGGSIVSTPGAAQTFEVQNIVSNLVIAPSATFVQIRVNTTAPRAITLPLAGSMPSGRIFKIKDITGSADVNNITIFASGSDLIDGSGTYVLDVTRGSLELVGNGVDTWDIN